MTCPYCGGTATDPACCYGGLQHHVPLETKLNLAREFLREVEERHPERKVVRK